MISLESWNKRLRHPHVLLAPISYGIAQLIFMGPRSDSKIALLAIISKIAHLTKKR